MDPNTTRMSDALTHHLRALQEEEGPKPTADNTILRASDAGKCARQIGFKALGYPKDYDYSDSSLRAFLTGNFWHEYLQTHVLIPVWGGEAEKTVSYRELGLSLSGDADGDYPVEGIFYDEDANTVLEIKTTKPYSYWVMVRGAGGPTWKPVEKNLPTGPKIEYVLQAAIYALSPQIQADFIHIVVFNKGDEVFAEWLFHVDQPLDFADGMSARQLHTRELERLAEIQAKVERGILPAPIHPEEGLIEDPPRHDSVGGKGGPWFCRYCDFNASCPAFGLGDFQTDLSPYDRADVADEPPGEVAA